MAGRGNRRDLYLQVSGDVSGLRTAMTAGKTVINDFSGAAINVIEQVEKELAKVGTSGLPGLKQTERAYQDTFRRIADSARAAANAPSDQVAAQILDANATREAAAAATAKAQSLRVLAEAAGRADQATGGNSAATRAYAVAAATAAVNAEQEANALREQLAVLQAVERELGVNTTAHRKQVAVSGEARAGYQQLSFQLGDVATQYAAGTSASLIFAQQSGQVIQAISLITGQTKGFLGFLGGPWGIALSSALVLLTPWVAKLLEGNDALGDAIEKLKKDAQEAETSRQAHAAYSSTLEGQIDAQRRLNEELERGLKSQRQINREKLQTGLDNQAKAIQELTKAESQLAAARTAAAKAREDRNNPAYKDPRLSAAVEARVEAADARAKTAEARVAAATAERDRAARGVRAANITIAADEARAAADPLEAINNRYNDMADAAKAAALDNDKLAKSIRGTLDSIEKQRAAAVKAEQDKQAAQKRTETDARNGRFTPTDIGGLLTAKYGGTITSTTGGRHVKGSYHYRGQAVDFVPRGGVGSVSKAEIRAYLQSEGVDLKELLGPGDKDHDDHFHVAFGKTRRGSDAIARSTESAEDRQTRNDDAYASLLSRVKDQQLRVEQSHLVSISEIAANDRLQVDLAREDINRAAEKGVALEQWTQAQADAVKLVAAQNAEAEKANITAREQVALRQQSLDAEIAQLDGQADLLRLQDQLAGTAKERRRIGLQLLEIEAKQARAAIQRQLVGEKDPARRAQLEADYQQQAESEPYRREILERQNASPIERYKQQLADFDVDDELETAEVRFFENLNDEMAESATRFLKLKGVAGEFFNQLIADVIRLQVRQALFGGGGGILGKLLNLGGKLGGNGGLGGVSTEASSALAGQAAAIELRNLRGFSIGGWTGHGRGKVKGAVHGDEYVFDADSTARIGVGTLDALRAGTLTNAVPAMPSVAAAERALSTSPAVVQLQVVEGAMFEPRVQTISGNVSVQVASSTAPVMIGAASGDAQASMARRARRQMR